MWRQPPYGKLRTGSRLSRLGEARRLAETLFFQSLCCWPRSRPPPQPGPSTPSPPPGQRRSVLFQVKPPAKLESLTGTWLGHQLTFSYEPATKTWFALAGVSIETAPGKYALELTAERATTKTPLTFTHTFAVARATIRRSKSNSPWKRNSPSPAPSSSSKSRKA